MFSYYSYYIVMNCPELEHYENPSKSVFYRVTVSFDPITFSFSLVSQRYAFGSVTKTRFFSVLSLFHLPLLTVMILNSL